MHFEPRIIADDGDDFDLPDDLMILAEQLTVDADRLATVYPGARQPRSTAAADDGALQVSPKSHWRRIAGAAAIMAAIGVGGWAAFDGRDAGNQPEKVAALPANPNHVAHQEPASRTAVATRVVDNNAEMSSVLFQDLTGPEQEAVLDLLEGDSGQPASLSI